MKDCEITKMGLLTIQVCSVLNEDDTLFWVQKNCPAGTSGNWQKQNEENLKPVKCESYLERSHFVFIC